MDWSHISQTVVRGPCRFYLVPWEAEAPRNVTYLGKESNEVEKIGLEKSWENFLFW